MTEQSENRCAATLNAMLKYSAEMGRVKALLDLAFANGARGSSAREDLVVFPLLVSCRDIVEEILSAVNEGHGRAALRSVRTMYECVVVARYLNVHPDKTEAFMEQFHVQWAKVMQGFPASSRSPELHAQLAAKVPKYAAGKPLGMWDLKWSGSGTLEMAKEAGQLAELHPFAFDYASAYVHPSSVYVISSLVQQRGTDSTFELSVRPQDFEAEQAISLAHDLVLNAVDLRLKYAQPSGLRELFTRCREDFERIWEYPSHL